MKFIPFPEATHQIAGEQLIDNNPTTVTVPFYSHEGYVVACVEVSPEDLKTIKKTNQIYLICGPGMHTIPPLALQVLNPFKPNPKKDGKNSQDKKDQDTKSPGDNQ